MRPHFSRQDIEHVSWAVRHHFMMVQLLDMPLGRQRHWFLDPRFPTLLALFYADAAGTTPTDLSLYKKVKAAYEECLRHFPERPKPLLTGEEVMKTLSLKAGPDVGNLLDELAEKQLSHEIQTPEEALRWLQGRR